jgi:hypothetical protein
MVARIYRPLKVIAFNANSIWRQRYELSKQVQDLHIAVALLSDTNLKHRERFCIPNYHFYQTGRFPGRKGGTAFAVRKGIPHNHVDLSPLVSIEATGVCIPIGNSEVYKSPDHTRNDADIIRLLSFRLEAGDLNAKYLFWNKVVSNTLFAKQLDSLHINEIEISTPHYPTHHCPAGNGDVLNIVANKNFQLSEIIVSYVLDSDHIPIDFHLMDHIKNRTLSDSVDEFIDWERFQSLAYELILPRIQINSGKEADKTTREFTASIAHRVSIYKITLSNLNKNQSGLRILLKHKRKLRKLWQVTRDPACEVAVNRVAETIIRMTRNRTLEQWETKVRNCEVTH